MTTDNYGGFEMKNKKTKIIIISVAVVAVAAIVIGIVGYSAGWFTFQEKEPVLKQIYDETGTIKWYLR